MHTKRTRLLCGISFAATLVGGCSSSGAPADPTINGPEASDGSEASNGRDASADSDASTACLVLSVSFQNDIIPVLAANCGTGTVCHGQVGNSVVEKLYLGSNADDGADGAAQIPMIYGGLVGVPAAEDPSMNRIRAGDLQNSYLWHKISGDPNADTAVAAGCQTVATGPNACSDCSIAFSTPCGAQMPVGGVLAPSDICTIANWIDGGAKNN